MHGHSSRMRGCLFHQKRQRNHQQEHTTKKPENVEIGEHRGLLLDEAVNKRFRFYCRGGNICSLPNEHCLDICEIMLINRVGTGNVLD